MKKTKVSKVVLPALLAGGLLLGGIIPSSATVVEAPKVIVLEEGVQIELPSSDYSFSVVTESKEVVKDFKDEALKVQKEREEKIQRELEEAKRKAEEQERRRIAEEKEIVRLAELEKKKKEAEDKGTKFNASYYTATCKGCTGITATGVDVRKTIHHKGYRVIAVDPRVIKLGSIVRVTTPHETFEAIAMDTGGAIKGHKVDILVSNKKTAYSLGRHSVYIKVIKK